MKAKLFLSLLIAGSTQMARANDFINMAEIQKLPALSAKAVVKVPGVLTPVQPILYLEFDYSSCAPRQFGMHIDTTQGPMLVKVVDNSPTADCKGLPQKRRYWLNLSSDFGGYAPTVVVLNPISYDIEQK